MYRPQAVGAPIGGDVELLVDRLMVHRVTLLLGAGVSVGEPTRLPLGPQVASGLYARFIGGIGQDALRGVDKWDLLAVADAVAAVDPAGTELLQGALTDFPFDSAEPNYGHRVMALLFAEKLIAVALTLNYDSCIERAAYRFSLTIQVCRKASDMQLGRDKGRLVKLHGCISDASTMLITS